MDKKLAKIHVMDYTGHSTIAEFDTSDTDQILVAQEKLTNFLDKCISDYGMEPPVWAKRIGQSSFDQVEDPRKADLLDVDEVLLQFPLVGG